MGDACWHFCQTSWHKRWILKDEYHGLDDNTLQHNRTNTKLVEACGNGKGASPCRSCGKEGRAYGHEFVQRRSLVLCDACRQRYLRFWFYMMHMRASAVRHAVQRWRTHWPDHEGATRRGGDLALARHWAAPWHPHQPTCRRTSSARLGRPDVGRSSRCPYAYMKWTRWKLGAITDVMLWIVFDTITLSTYKTDQRQHENRSTRCLHKLIKEVEKYQSHQPRA